MHPTVTTPPAGSRRNARGIGSAGVVVPLREDSFTVTRDPRMVAVDAAPLRIVLTPEAAGALGRQLVEAAQDGGHR